MTAWIFSTEPAAFPWSRVEFEKTVRWDGIRGPLARKSLRAILPGDRVWGYHSSPAKALVCLARAKGKAYPDPADEKWLAIDIAFDQWIKHPISLSALRAHPGLSSMDFLRSPRLSVAVITDVQDEILFRLAENGEAA